MRFPVGSRGRLAAATIAAAAAAVACGTVSPTAPGALAAVLSVSPGQLTWSTAAQTLTISGKNFKSGMTMVVTGPLGTETSTTRNADIQTVSATSAQVSLVLTGMGNFTLQVTGSATSGALTVAVADRRVGCSNPLPLVPQYDPRVAGPPTILAMLVDRTTVTDTIARLMSQYQFQPKTIWTGLGGFSATAPDTVVDALRCDPAIKVLSYNSTVTVDG